MNTEVRRKAIGQSTGKSKKRKRGRPKATSISVTSWKQISALKTRYSLPEAVLTYRDVARELTKRSGVKVSVATVYRMVNDGYKPKRESLRRALEFVRPYRDLFSWPVKELARAICNRR